MKDLSLPSNEKERLSELYRYELLDTPYEKELDDIVQLASQICGTPIAAIGLVDSTRQWLKARVGLECEETDRSLSFCSYAILQNDLLEIKDTHCDERFKDLVASRSNDCVRFFAGMPLVTEKGHSLGALYVADSVPRRLTNDQAFALKVLAGHITDRIELRMRNKELQHLTRTYERIISIIAHDVRNPLASLKSILELKELNMVTEEEADELMSISNKQIDNTIDMVSNIVEWGRLQVKRQLQQEQVNLHQLVNKVFNGYELAASLKNNRLINEVAEHISIETNPQALQFILRNLVSNAIKFTENGFVKISSEPVTAHHNIAFKICDSGVGIEPDRLQTMFDAHKNFSTPGTKNEKGSGLGLVLIKEYLDKEKGSIHLSSTRGQGTCVTISL